MSSRNRQQTTQTQNQSYSGTSTYGWTAPPDTADIQAMRNFQFGSDPRVGYAFARTRRDLANSNANPLGAYSTPGLRDARYQAQLEDLGQQEAQALREENYARQGLDYARTADVANMTQPRIVETSRSGSSSGTSSGNTVQSQGVLPSLISGGSTVGAALLM